MSAPTKQARQAIGASGGKAKARSRAIRAAVKPGAEFNTIEDYDRILGAPGSWADVKRREEARGEITLNGQRLLALESARIALDKERGKITDRSEVRKAAILVRDAIAAELTTVAQRVMAQHQDAPADLQARMSSAIDRAINAALDSAVEKAQAKRNADAG